MVVVKHATEALSAHDAAACGCVVVRCHDELVAERLMRPLSVIVLDVLLNDLPQVAFAQRNDTRETLAPNRADPALRVGVEIWTARRQLYTFDTARREHRAECVRIQWVASMMR